MSDFPVRASIAVSDIHTAAEFYKGRLGLPLAQSGRSAAIEDGGRIAWFQDPDGNTFAVEADDCLPAGDFDGRLDS
ncbi:hypothetical protein [Allobranchiibius sp. GilTou38]|uniref:VOC family protein n=1 Tax=Allobranchiibius sp. GilTou38 TaxID=2815210 RepID=UPI001FB58D01|nr:hypothetical protein [Allobranchiibius sp. GilTou38]